jgi:hypothetical protein
MSNAAPPPDMAWHLRHLLEAVREAACGLEGRWKWLTGPLALLTRFWTRRERKEAAQAMAAMQGLVQGFLTLLEDFRAGRLPECAKPEVVEESEEVAPRRCLTADAATAERLIADASADGRECRVNPRVEAQDGNDDNDLFCHLHAAPAGTPGALSSRRISSGWRRDDGGLDPACAGLTHPTLLTADHSRRISRGWRRDNGGVHPACAGLTHPASLAARPEIFLKIEVKARDSRALIVSISERKVVTAAESRALAKPRLSRPAAVRRSIPHRKAREAFAE